MSNQKPRIHFTSPVMPIDCGLSAYDGPIWPCTECLPWHVEVLPDPDEGDEMLIREWHAVDCPVYIELDKISRGIEP